MTTISIPAIKTLLIAFASLIFIFLPVALRFGVVYNIRFLYDTILQCRLYSQMLMEKTEEKRILTLNRSRPNGRQETT